jgi:HlyD family secretion protein
MDRKVGAIAVAIVAIGGGAAFYGLNATDAPTVVSSPVTRGDVVQKVEATGTVQPVDSVEVGAQVTGTIKTLGATFNSEVRKGQILATLDPASLQAEVDQARANLVRLQAQYEQAKVALEDASIKLARAERLSKDQLIAQADFDVARVTRDGVQAALKSADAQVVQARASLAQTQVALQHTVITSPTDGMVLARNVEVGQTVTSGLQTPTLFVIARDLGTMQVSASVDESDIGRVAKGQPVTFTTDAYAGDVFSGTVSEVRLQPVVTQNVVTYTTIITVPNPGAKLKPGMTATVEIESARASDTLRVPAAAIRFRPPQELTGATGAKGAQGAKGARGAQGAQGAWGAWGARGARGLSAGAARAAKADATARARAVVWQVVDGTLKPVRVTVGISDGTEVAVTSDALQPGMQVATSVKTGDQASASRSGAGTSPLMPSMGRRSGGAR